jgi:hypothetical protein
MEDHSPGDILHVESEIVEITPSRSKPHQGIITLRGTMFNRNREAVYLLTANLLVLRRPQLIEGSPLIQKLAGPLKRISGTIGHGGERAAAGFPSLS